MLAPCLLLPTSQPPIANGKSGSTNQPPMILAGGATPLSFLQPLTAQSGLCSLSRRRRLKYPTSVAASVVDTFSKNSGYLFELSESASGSIIEYDISDITALYVRKPLVLMQRVFQIGTAFGRWFAMRYVDGLMGRADAMFKVRAAELREILVELGPAYVKIAQAVSSRPDLIPPPFLEELSLLQDQITPFSNEVAFNTIELELGLGMEELFSEISPEPVAAASVGQVYKAKLWPTEMLVAVKVQRPGVLAAISLDTLILRSIAGLVRRARKLNTDLQAVVDEWACSLFQEMDYIKEAENGVRFRELYGGLEDVFVPHMYIKKSTSKVLVMEWVEGGRLSEVNDLRLVEVGVYCSLNQLLEYGFYHADPHPGNLLRTYDGKLAYLDFGMMGEFKQELCEGFIEACLHLVNRDFNALARDFITLGRERGCCKGINRLAFLIPRPNRSVFENAVSKGVRNINFGDLSSNLGLTMYKFKFRIPSYFSLVIRSLAVLEGIAISFNRDYKVLGSAYPWIARKVLTDSSPQLKSSLEALLYEEGVFKIDRLESLVKEGIDALGLVTYSSITSSAAANFAFPSFIPVMWMTEEDITNLRNFRRLMLLVFSYQNIEGRHRGIEEVGLYTNQALDIGEITQLFYQISSIQEVLPILSILSELPLEQQQQFFIVPVKIGARLISRMAARTIRRSFI